MTRDVRSLFGTTVLDKIWFVLFGLDQSKKFFDRARLSNMSDPNFNVLIFDFLVTSFDVYCENEMIRASMFFFRP